LTGSACSQLLGDVWYALDALWRTAQIVHLIAAAFDATWQVIIIIVLIIFVLFCFCFYRPTPGCVVSKGSEQNSQNQKLE